MDYDVENAETSTGWIGRSSQDMAYTPAARLGRVVERGVNRLAKGQTHRLTTVSMAVARDLSVQEPMTAYLMGVDDIAERVAPLVRDAATKLGRSLQDDGGQGLSTGNAGQEMRIAASCSPLPPAGQRKGTRESLPMVFHQQAASEQPPSGQTASTAEAARQTAPDGGHPEASEAGQRASTAEAAKLVSPAPTHPKDDGDQLPGTAKAVTPSASPSVRPKPAPNRSPRSAAGIARASEGLMSHYRLRDGRAIGDIRWGELTTLAARSAEEARVLEAIRKRGKPTDTSVRVRDILRETDLAEIVSKAKEAAA